ncbi:MAG: ThuA domain-containing protein, partial [Planctomycetota bacterium]
MKKVLMIVGGAHHPFGPCGRIGKQFLETTGKYELDVTEDLDALPRLGPYDAVMVYTCGLEMTPEQFESLREFVRDGGGLVGVHSATASFRNQPEWFDLVGSEFLTHPREHPHFRVRIADPDHSITARLGEFDITDEFYRLTDVRDDTGMSRCQDAIIR